MKIKILFAMTLALFGLVSCGQTNYTDVAHKSEPLRLLLAKYYELNGRFPDDPNSLTKLDPKISFQGGLWNGWNYGSSDTYAYDIWIYPGRTRQSLWLKFNVKSPSETGWFINNDNGDFIPQKIPLLPQEQNLLQKNK